MKITDIVEDIGDVVYYETDKIRHGKNISFVTFLIVNGRKRGHIDLMEPSPENEGVKWSIDSPIHKALYVVDVQIDPIYRGKGYGFQLYKHAISDAKKRHKLIIISGNPQSSDALRIWIKLANEGKVKKDREWGMYIDLREW